MKKFYLALFLLAGFLFGLISCTKEAETNQPLAVLSPLEANVLLAKSIQSTKDDVIYLDMTSEQAKKMGITEKLYQDALAQIDILNKSIRKSKEKGITIVNGFKKSNKMPETKWNSIVDPFQNQDRIWASSDLLKKGNNAIRLNYNPNFYIMASCRISTYPMIESYPDNDDYSPNYLFFDVTVQCINSGQICEFIGTGYAPNPSFHFNCGPFADKYEDWRFQATLNYSDRKQIWLSFELYRPEPQ